MCMTTLRDNIIPASLITLSAIGITFALYSMKAILVPFVFSIFLYFIVSPVIGWFKETCRMPRFIAVFITFCMVILFFTGFILMLGISIKGIIESGAQYSTINLIIEDFLSNLSNSSILKRFNITLNFSIIQQFLTSLPILDWINNLYSSVLGIISNILLILIFLLFFAIGEKSETARQIIDDEVESKITRYIATKFFTSFLTGLLIYICLLIFNIQFAFLFSVITFFLNFIPNIGSIIAILAIVPILFLQFGLGLKFIILLSIVSAIQFIIGNIIDPKLMGEKLGLHPVLILLSLLFWGYIWGIPGMFLAAPMSAVIKLLINRSKITQFFIQAFETEV